MIRRGKLQAGEISQVHDPAGLSLAAFANDFKSDAYREELRGNWASAVLYRAPAVVLAWLCARLGLRPIVVTLMALLVALLLPVLAFALPISTAPVWVFLGGAIYQILDCVDGTLARTTGQMSRRGADLDFIIDMAQWGLLYLSIGFLADRSIGTGWEWTLLGVCAAWARLMARVIRDRVGDPQSNETPRPLRPIQLPALFLAGISGLIPFLALSGSWIGAAVIALLIYGLLDIAEGLLPLARRA